MLERPRAEPSLDVLRQIGELKRVRSAGRDGSIATRLFASAWRRELAGEADAAFATTAAALAAASLGDIDVPTLSELGLAAGVAARVRHAALDGLAERFEPALRVRLARALEAPEPHVVLPGFVERLTEQPRAGVTCPGRPRILFEPPENHAEHCLMVAVYGVLLAQRYGADPAIVFLAGLAHHMHNARLPDSGFTGEALLGSDLALVVRNATALAMDELDASVRARVAAAREILVDAGTPEGRAFHAADAIDRVLQIEQHLRPGQVSMRTVLHDMALVHEGPVKRFQDDVLAEMGLAA